MISTFKDKVYQLYKRTETQELENDVVYAFTHYLKTQYIHFGGMNFFCKAIEKPKAMILLSLNKLYPVVLDDKCSLNDKLEDMREKLR